MGIVGVTYIWGNWDSKSLGLNSKQCSRKVTGPESPKGLLNPQFRAPSLYHSDLLCHWTEQGQREAGGWTRPKGWQSLKTQCAGWLIVGQFALGWQSRLTSTFVLLSLQFIIIRWKSMSSATRTRQKSSPSFTSPFMAPVQTRRCCHWKCKLQVPFALVRTSRYENESTQEHVNSAEECSVSAGGLQWPLQPPVSLYAL